MVYTEPTLMLSLTHGINFFECAIFGAQTYNDDETNISFKHIQTRRSNDMKNRVFF